MIAWEFIEKKCRLIQSLYMFQLASFVIALETQTIIDTLHLDLGCSAPHSAAAPIQCTIREAIVSSPE